MDDECKNKKKQMEQTVQILMLFILIGAAVKLSFWKWWQAALFGLVCALFIIFICRYAILQSKTELNYYLNNKQIMQDIAVLVTIEAVLCFAFVFVELFSGSGSENGRRGSGCGNGCKSGCSSGCGGGRHDNKHSSRCDNKCDGKCDSDESSGEYGESKNKRALRLCLYAYPGLLIFPVLFYLLTQAIYFFAGVDFTTVSYLLALSTGVLLPLLSLGLKFLCPDREFRLEIYLLVSVFICIIGLITTADNDIVYMVK